MKITCYNQHDESWAYRYSITIRDLTQENKSAIKTWIAENKLPCSVILDTIYINDDKNLNWFLLKWM